MPEKPKAAKKKSPATPSRPAKAAAPAAPAKSNSRSRIAKPKAPQRKSTFYVSPSRTATVSSDRPKDVPGSREFPSFAEARRAAIDELVAAIESAELQLLSLKRATRFEELSTNGASK
jgi:hypothetical protein